MHTKFDYKNIIIYIRRVDSNNLFFSKKEDSNNLVVLILFPISMSQVRQLALFFFPFKKIVFT